MLGRLRNKGGTRRPAPSSLCDRTGLSMPRIIVVGVPNSMKRKMGSILLAASFAATDVLRFRW